MESALIVSSTDKGTAFFTELLNAASINQIASLKSCTEARRFLLERDFDLVIINAPLPDETGESLAKHIAAKGLGQVLLVVKTEYFEAISAVTEDLGILTIQKPIQKTLLWSAVKLAKAAQSQVKRLHRENSKLTQRIEDIRMIDRAKCVLISVLKISEQEAHRYIEKQAMDMRTTKRSIAEGILKTYEE